MHTDVDHSSYPDDVTASPVVVVKFGQPYGWPFDLNATADEIVAIGEVDGSLRGTSTLLTSPSKNHGFQLGFVGKDGDAIAFYYWDSREQREYKCDVRPPAAYISPAVLVPLYPSFLHTPPIA